MSVDDIQVIVVVIITTSNNKWTVTTSILVRLFVVSSFQGKHYQRCSIITK